MGYQNIIHEHMKKFVFLVVLLPMVACSQSGDLGFWAGTPEQLSGCKTWVVRIEPSLIVNLQVPVKTTNCFGEEETIIFYPSDLFPIFRSVCSVTTPTSTSDLVSDISETIYDCDGNAVGSPCDQQANYQGTNEFPAEFVVSLGTSTGTVEVDFAFGQVPDRMVIERLNGAIVLDTGWRGSTTWQTSLNQGLAELGLPPVTITSPGNGTVSFNKTFSDPVVRVKVFTSYFLGSSSWDVTVKCPQ